MLDKNDKNKFKSQNYCEHTDITIIQHTLLENKYPERGRKLPFREVGIADAYELENKYPERGRKLNVCDFLCNMFELENKYPERGRKRK